MQRSQQGASATLSSSSPAPLCADRIRELAHDLGADAVGLAPASPVQAKERFLQWLARGFAAEMAYLERHARERFDPGVLLPGAQTVVVLGFNYYPSRRDREEMQEPCRVAKYAWGEDYHRVLRRALRDLRRQLTAERSGLRGRICVDTAPFMDKYWAAMAGLGWQGKHTNLVSRDFGSWLLLGSLVLDAPADAYDSPHDDFCGSCTACLEACPTNAFPAPYQLDARRCISYWTIESRARRFPPHVEERLEPWVFGCDICLDVCPWNKFERVHGHPEFERLESIGQLEAGAVQTWAPDEFVRSFGTSPVIRPGFQGILRNVEACLRGV